MIVALGKPRSYVTSSSVTLGSPPTGTSSDQLVADAIEGGVNSSLNLDSHGKSWSFLLLELEVEVD